MSIHAVYYRPSVLLQAAHKNFFCDKFGDGAKNVSKVIDGRQLSVSDTLLLLLSTSSTLFPKALCIRISSSLCKTRKKYLEQ